MAESVSASAALSSPPDDVDSVHELLESVWAVAPDVNAVDRISFETALVELASNVVRHAHDGAGVRWTVTVTASEERLEAHLMDDGRGEGIDLTERAMPDTLDESGRGVPLIQALVDSFDYERVGGCNRWRITRERTRA